MQVQMILHNNIYQILWKKKLKFSERELYQDFLSQVGAEEAMSSDQVIWSEQGRLHYLTEVICVALQQVRINITKDIDGIAITTTHGIRVNDQVLIAG